MEDFNLAFPLRMRCWSLAYDARSLTINIKCYLGQGYPEMADNYRTKRNAALRDAIKLMLLYSYPIDAIRDTVNWMLCRTYGD